MAERLKLTLKRKGGGDPIAGLRPHARSFSGGGFSILHDFEDEALCLAFHSETEGQLHVVLAMQTVAELTGLLQEHLDSYAAWSKQRGRHHGIELRERTGKPRSRVV